jgi:thiamine biosynthesis protein ThiS
MNIILNNNSETIEETSITVTQLLKLRNFTFKMLVIKINGKLIQKTDYKTTTIHDGDDVSVLHLISGG